jgi:endonuclease/exonuclease/phosphatase family metal-dependent hydrolase
MTASTGSEPLQLRLLTHNIRYATSSPSKGELPWDKRAPLVLNQLRHEVWPFTSDSTSSAAFICLQEVLHTQLFDVLHGLNGLPPPSSRRSPDAPSGPIWAHIGVGREDGKTEGEYSPILYPVKVFDVLHSETVWLSEMPDRPSKGWDAGSIRILTVGVFEHKASGRRVVAANTHLDNAGEQSRFESIRIILETLKRVEEEWGDGGNVAVFLTGDFNSFPTQEAYMAMKDSGYLVDVYDAVPDGSRHGEGITFTGFDPEEEKDLQGRIDFVWLGPGREGGKVWAVDQYSVLSNCFEAGGYLSDHRAVVADVRLL